MLSDTIRRISGTMLSLMSVEEHRIALPLFSRDLSELDVLRQVRQSSIVMPGEEVEDEILALESIYEDKFSRTGDNQIRAIVKPEDETEGESNLQGAAPGYHGHDDLQFSPIASYNGLMSSWACLPGSSLLYIEAELPENYPSETIPDFSLSNINNNHFSAHIKEEILSGLNEQVSHNQMSASLLSVCSIGWCWCFHSHMRTQPVSCTMRVADP